MYGWTRRIKGSYAEGDAFENIIMGYGVTVAQGILVPLIQVRILVAQPFYNGVYTLRLISGRKVNWLHAGSTPATPTNLYALVA